MQRGRFITLEGMDGAGKSTHLPFIEQLLRSGGREVLVTREPGGTPLGERLRQLLLHEDMHPETETLLMFAARREHVEQVIKPALARGVHVLSDRFTDASYAYQGGGRGVPTSKLRELEQWVLGGFQPDITLLFDVPVAVSAARLAGARDPDKFEKENGAFFEKIRDAYLRRVEECPGRFRVIDAEKSIGEIQKELEEIFITI